MALGYGWAGRVRHPKNVLPITPRRRVARLFSAKRGSGHTLRSRDLPIRLILEVAVQHTQPARRETCRNSLGETPALLRKKRVKCAGSENPRRVPISLTGKS